MIWAILAASSIGVLIALLGFRVPMLILAAGAGLFALLMIGLLGGHGLVTAFGHAIAGVVALQLSYVVCAAVTVWAGEGRAFPRSAGAPGRRLLSLFWR